MKIISERDLSYIAGYFDGEGCASLTKSSNDRYSPGIRIINTHKETIEWLLETTGIGRIVKLTGVMSIKHKIAYGWILRVEEMPEFLIALIPFLKQKKERAERLLEFLSLPKCPIGQQLNGHNPITEKDRILRQVIYEEMKELNQKGPV